MKYSRVDRILVSSGTQVQPQMILDPDYLPNYLFLSLCHMFPHTFKGWDERMSITLPCESMNYLIHEIKSYMDTTQEKVKK